VKRSTVRFGPARRPSIRVAISEVKGGAPIGAFGRVVVNVSHRDGVLVVPSAALRGAVSDGAEVLVCKDGHAELRKLGLGFRDETRVEVRRGLELGDRVAMDHVLGLDDGTAIKELP